MLNYQPFVQQLETLTFTIGTTGKQEFDLKKLEKTLYKTSEIANVIGFVFEADLDPTFTAAPTVIGHNNAVANVLFSDGKDNLFDGSFNDMRYFERMEHGGSIMGEAITQTSTNSRYWTRFLPVGPPNLLGWPSDFGVSAAELAQSGAKLQLTPTMVLTDISADTTAAVLAVTAYALMVPSGRELKMGAKYQRIVKPIVGTQTNIADEALYAYIGAVDAAYAAFAAGDFAKVSVFNTIIGQLVAAVDAEGMGRAFNVLHRPGLLNQVVGEPRDATYDVAARIVSASSPTALAAQALDLQMFLFTPPNTRMSKMRARNGKGDTLTIQHSGAQAANTGSYLCGRFLPHDRGTIDSRARAAATLLGVSYANPELKTLNKRAVKPSELAVKYGTYASKVS